MPQPAEDGRQMGKQQGHGAAIARVEMSDDLAAEPAAAGILPYAESPGKVLRGIQLPRVPQDDLHQRLLCLSASSASTRRQSVV
jgi:hypothetical protein